MQQRGAEKELPSSNRQKLVLISKSNLVSRLRTEDKLLKTLESPYIDLAMNLVPKISSWAVAKVYELKHNCKSPCRERSGRGKQGCELFAVRYGKVGIAPLLPSIVAKYELYFH